MIAVGLLLVACQFDTNLGANDAYLFQSGGVELEARIIHQGNDVIWGFDFFPDGRIIFTERDGRLKIFDPESSETIEVAGAPSVMVQNQGGLLDV
ncbi:MAG: PQQ-dependent sugar dehydrogenase, partial [Gammaproteobacteria bacterium]